jgi:methylmalonyl-CoA mutase
MENLFQEFESVTLDEWVNKIYADLKDKPKELLSYSPEWDLSVKSFYHKQEAPSGNYSTGRFSNSCKNRCSYKKATNKLILNDLNSGIDSLGFIFKDQSSFDELTKGVQFNYIDADVQFDDSLNAKSFIGPTSIKLNYDIIGQGLVKGKWLNKLNDFLDFYQLKSNHQNIWVSGFIYSEAGATTSQELAYTASHVNEYIQLLTDAGVSLAEINDRLIIELSVTEDFFTNISKFKLIQYIIQLVFKGYDKKYELKPITLYAKTSPRYLAVNDANNNLLRQTTQAMSAIIGGCDAISISTISTGDWNKDQIMERMAKNIPLILKEESYFDKVIDPSEGSYYLEHLNAQIMNNAWGYFKEMEDQGGLIAAVESEWLQFNIAKSQTHLLESVNKNQRTFLGVNKFQSSTEKWTEVETKTSATETDFLPLNQYIVEEKFDKQAHEQSKV